MSDNLRARIYNAVLSILGPGSPEGDPHPDAEPITDEVMAVLDQQLPPMFVLDPPELSPEETLQVAAWQASWAEAIGGDTTQHLMIPTLDASDAVTLSRVRAMLARLDDELDRSDTGERWVLTQITDALNGGAAK